MPSTSRGETSRTSRSLPVRLFRAFAGLTLAATALNGSAGAAFAQSLPSLPPPGPLQGFTFIVNTNTDTDDGVCDSTNCTLREAINHANANSSPFNIADHIQFQIPIEQTLVIHLASSLPPLTSPVTIDGNNQPSPVTTVINGQPFTWLVPHPGVVDVQGGSGASTGLTLNTSATITNLELTGFSGSAVSTSGTGTKKLDSLSVHFNSGAGVTLLGSNATLSNSTISVSNPGVTLGGSQNTVSGNIITTNSVGVQLSGVNDTLGGTTVAARNVISGNTGAGVSVTSTASSTRIVGNFIGTDANGTSAVANTGDGIFVNTTNSNTIGGPTAAERNIISGNGGNGISMELGATPNFGTMAVQGNFIGTNVNGTAALGNTLSGVQIDGSNSPGLDDVSGRAQLTGNVISGNHQNGVLVLGGAHHVLQSNFIGTDLGATLSLGNGANQQFHGVFIQDARRITIGGDTPALANVIAHNANSGVTIFTATANSVTSVGNTVRLNSIFDNGRLDLDLAQTSAEAGFGIVTPDDFNDADLGPNRLQNFPVLQTGVAPSGGGLTVVGTLSSTPLTAFAVDFYASPACDIRGAGPGQQFLGTVQVVTSAANPGLPGTAVAVLSVAPNPPVTGGVVTAAATNLSTGDTSEFSACLAVTTR